MPQMMKGSTAKPRPARAADGDRGPTLAFAAGAAVAPRHGPGTGWRRFASTCARPPALLVLASILLSSVVTFNLIGDRMLYGSLGFVFWADFLALLATYLLLLPAVRQPGVRALPP